MTVGDFLKAAMADQGPWNCSTMAADWCVALGHPDFAAEWRGIVDPGPCESVPAEAGGLLALWNRGIGASLPVADDLHPGDIAVIRVLGIDAGGIWTGKRWAVKAQRGLHMLEAGAVHILKAWRP